MNLAHMIDEHDAEVVALISGNRGTTYGELRSQVDGVRGALVDRGVQPGDRVVILCGNSRFFVVAYLAVLGAGAIAVPLNPTSPAPEIERQVGVVAPAAAIVGPPAQATWRSLDADLVGSIGTIAFAEPNDALPEGVVGFDQLESSKLSHPVVEVQPDDIAVMVFTSGTAGMPKAAMLSHFNLSANIEQSHSANDHVRAGDVMFGVLPLFHIFGLNVQLNAALLRGATLLLVARFDPATAAQSIATRKIAVVPGAPAMWTALSQLDGLAADTFASVRIATSGASRLPTTVTDAMRTRFGVDIAEGYGLTEASPVVTSSVGIPHRPGSVGRALPGVEIQLVGDDGDDVPVGDAGEVWVRGDNVFRGYYLDQEATDRVITPDGWLKTGDIGIADEDGYLYLVDRAKDLIIVSGFNVFPAEVEEVLNQHPSVVESGVLGVPHPHKGEAVKAYVVLRPGVETSEDQLIDYASNYLARYKCPSKVLFVDQLPRNSTGKLMRRELEGTVMETS